MEICNEYRRPRAISCSRFKRTGSARSRPDPWGPDNSYFRACFDTDMELGEEASDSIASVRRNDCSVCALPSMDYDEKNDDDDDEDGSGGGLRYHHCRVEDEEDAGDRKPLSFIDDNVNRFNDDSSSRRGDRFDESGFEQDYLDDFESTASGSESLASLASSTRRRTGGAQGVDDESTDGVKNADSEKTEEQGLQDNSEVGSEDEENTLNFQNLDPEPPEEYKEEVVETNISGNINTKLSINQCRLRGNRVLMRVDLNVPVEDGQIMNMEKMELALPTIQYALDKGAKSVVLMSHMGRPEGRVVPELSLRPLAVPLESLLGDRTVTFLEDCVGESVEQACADPEPGAVILLENLRFHPEEEGKGVNDEGEKVRSSPEDVQAFRESLSRLGDVYVNDAFGTAHRAHSSVVGIDVPERVAGFLLKKEIQNVSKVVDEPQTPYLAIVGGGTVSDKANLIDNLLNSVTDIIIAGGAAFTFLKVLNDMEIGDSPFDDEMAEFVPQIQQKALNRNVNLHFPVDFVVANRPDMDFPLETVDEETGIPAGMVGLDIGERSRGLFTDIVSRAKTIIWNGPLGAWEADNFSEGSKAIVKAISEAIEREVPVILGDRETANCAKKFDLNMDSVMTGGACLELLEGKVLPGVAALTARPKLWREANVRRMRTCPLANQRVGIRLDLDVAVSKDDDDDEFFVDDNEIPKLVAASSTITTALRMGAMSVVIFSHRGNPKGQPEPELSMEPVARKLGELLKRPVTFVADCVGEATRTLCTDPYPGSVFVLENLKFYPEEEGKMENLLKRTKKSTASLKGDAVDVGAEEERISMEKELSENEVSKTKKSARSTSVKPSASMKRNFADQVAEFRAALSRLIDVFIMDDFSALHMPYSSVVGLKGRVKACGPQVERELEVIARSLVTPDRPLAVVLGGDNIQEMFDLIPGLLGTADDIILGGALAFPFLAAMNHMPIGNSPTIEAVADQVPELMAAAVDKQTSIHLPVDIVVSASPDTTDAEVTTVGVEEGIPEDAMGLDIGARSRAEFADVIGKAKTIVWCGPLGAIEAKEFQGGTDAILDAVSKATDNGAISLLADAGIVSYVRTKQEEQGGSLPGYSTTVAAIKLLAGETIPGLALLDPGFKPKSKKRRKRRKKKKKKKEQPTDEKIMVDRRTRIAAWLERTKDWNYKPPAYRRELPPLPQPRKSAPPIKYTGAPPPGKSKSIGAAVKLFKSRPWEPLPPPPPPLKKPHVPRLASLKRPQLPAALRRCASEAPWSHKHKIGQAGTPGHLYFRPQSIPLPCIPPGPDKEKLPPVPTQVPVIAKFDKGGNLLVHVDGTKKGVPEDAKIQLQTVILREYIIPGIPRKKIHRRSRGPDH